MRMRYKCSDCKGLMYSSCPLSADEPCIYCGGKDLELDGIEEDDDIPF